MRPPDGIEQVLSPAPQPNVTDGSPAQSFEWDALVSAVSSPTAKDDELRETRLIHRVPRSPLPGLLAPNVYLDAIRVLV